MPYHKTNLHTYAGRHLADYFKTDHPAYHLPSLLFPPIALAKEMFANLRFKHKDLLPDNAQLLLLSETNGALPTPATLWQLFIRHIIHSDDTPPYTWQNALIQQSEYRARLEQDIYTQTNERTELLTALKTATLIEPLLLEQVICCNNAENLLLLKMATYTDFYLTFIATFDQAVVEEIILYCAEENIDLPYAWTPLTDSGFIGQILPQIHDGQLLYPDRRLLTFFYQRDNCEQAYFYQACRLAEKINYGGVHRQLLKNITHPCQVSCKDWHHWLARNGKCPKKEIPGFFLDLFFLSRAISKFIRYQTTLLQQAGMTCMNSTVIKLYNRYPQYFNRSEITL